MKVKYKFNKIQTEADTLVLKSGDEELVSLKKEDYGENWEELKKIVFEINPYLSSGDLSELTVTGLETNTLDIPGKEAEKELWKKYCNDKIDLSVFSKKIAKVSDDIDTVIISNYKNINISNFYDLVQKLCTNTSNKFLDLSKITTELSKDCIWNITYGSYKQQTIKVMQLIKKLPKFNVIPDSLKSGHLSLDNFSSLEDLSQFFKYKYNYFSLNENKKIEELSNISLNENAAFYIKNSNVKILPNQYIRRIDISECKNLKEIEELKLSIPIISNNASTINTEQNLNTNSVLHIHKLLTKCYDLPAYSYYYFSPFVNVDEKTKITIDYIEVPHIKLNLFNNYVNLGVVNVCGDNFISGSSAAIVYNQNIKAFPAYKLNCDFTSTNTNDDKIAWVDYYKNGSSNNFKNITISSPSEEEIITINTLKKEMEELEVQIPIPFIVNPEYPYTFKLLKIEKIIAPNTYGHLKNENDKNDDAMILPGFSGDASFVYLKIRNIKNIKDEHYLQGTIELDREYVAEIDGYEFHGKEHIKANIKIVFNLDEQIIPSVSFEDDEGNELNLPLNNPAE